MTEVVIDRAKPEKRFWMWPWILAAFILHFFTENFVIDDSPKPIPFARLAYDFALQWLNVLPYFIVFIIAVLVFRYKTKSRTPSVTAVLSVSCLAYCLMKWDLLLGTGRIIAAHYHLHF